MTTLRVQILSVVFPPDGVSTAQLVGEIAQNLSALGHEVAVVTSQPHYNIDAVARAEQQISWHWSGLFGTSEFGGAEVVHVRMGPKSSRIPGRAAQWLWFHIVSFLLSWGRRADVCLIVSPPPTLAVQGAVRRALGGPPFVYAVWEAYPDILFAMDVIKPTSLVGRVALRLETWTYRRADRVMFLTDAMLAAALKREPSLAAKGVVIPTFVDVDAFSPASRSTGLRKELGIDDTQFVFGYAGNLGPAQDLSVVLEAADLLAERNDIVFVICGSGSDEGRLRERAVRLRNVVFTGHLPFVRMPEVYATFDVSLVPLASGLSSEALPSKVYRSMACGRPVLAITDDGSALAEVVRQTSSGLVAAPATEGVRDALEAMAASDELDAWGRAARDFVVAAASRPVVIAQIERLLDQAATASRGQNRNR